jgi:hypothetical protein
MPTTAVTGSADAGGPAVGEPSRTSRRLQSVAPLLVSFLIPIGVLCAVAIARRQFPFGPGSRSLNDLGNAYVPLHAHLHDLLLGAARGDLLFTWNAALGTPFLPDYVINLSSPFAPLVAFFPRDRIELAVFVITVLKYGAAAAAMARYLRVTYGGSRWLAPVFGMSYALCAWGFDDGSYVPMWLDGLVALPLLLRAVEWGIARRPLWQPALVVALAWEANFYTGFMASALASLVLVVRLVTLPLTLRERGAAIGRLAVAFGAGLALTAPLLLPMLRAVRAAQPADTGSFVPAPWRAVIARLLPGTEGVGVTPSLATGSVVLLLAVGFLAEDRIPRPVRVAWGGLAAAVLLSFQWAPTQAAWHGFETPNGSRYRQAFVFSALLVILGWQTLRAGPLRPRVVVVGAAGVAACLLAASRDYVDEGVVAGVVVAAAVGVAALVAFQAARRMKGEGGRRWVAWVAVAIALLSVATQSAVADVRMDRLRAERYPTQQRTPDLRGAAWAAARRAEPEAGRTGRVDPGLILGSNSSLLLRADGSSYYSNAIAADQSHFFVAAGGGWGGLQRAVYAPPVAASDAVLAIARRVEATAAARGPGTSSPTVTVTAGAVAPFITVRPGARPDPRLGADPYEQHEFMLGSPVYERPAVAVRDRRALEVRPDASGSFRFSGRADAPATVFLSGRCIPGSTVLLWAPALVGAASADGAAPVPYLSPGSREPGVYTGAALRELGVVLPSGSFTVSLTVRGRSVIPRAAVACADGAALRSVVENLRRAAMTDVRVEGHGMSARVAADERGLMVAAVPEVPGWGCAVDGAEALPASSFHGLLAVDVPAGQHDVECSYRTPGLDAGLLVAAAGALLLIAATFVPRRRLRPSREV